METRDVDSKLPEELPQQEPFPELPQVTPSTEAQQANKNGNKRTRETENENCISMRVLEHIPAIKSTTHLCYIAHFLMILCCERFSRISTVVLGAFVLH